MNSILHQIYVSDRRKGVEFLVLVYFGAECDIGTCRYRPNEGGDGKGQEQQAPEITHGWYNNIKNARKKQ
jgi:hypothetical protein